MELGELYTYGNQIIVTVILQYSIFANLGID